MKIIVTKDKVPSYLAATLYLLHASELEVRFEAVGEFDHRDSMALVRFLAARQDKSGWVYADGSNIKLVNSAIQAGYAFRFFHLVGRARVHSIY